MNILTISISRHLFMFCCSENKISWNSLNLKFKLKKKIIFYLFRTLTRIHQKDWKTSSSPHSNNRSLLDAPWMILNKERKLKFVLFSSTNGILRKPKDFYRNFIFRIIKHDSFMLIAEKKVSFVKFSCSLLPKPRSKKQNVCLFKYLRWVLYIYIYIYIYICVCVYVCVCVKVLGKDAAQNTTNFKCSIPLLSRAD